MEKLTHCLVCGSKLTGDEYLSAADHLYSGSLFSIEKCGTCSFMFTNPRPDPTEIHDYYASDEYVSHSDRRNNIREFLYHKTKKYMLGRKLKLLKKHINAESALLLDYGCGTGDFVIAAKKAGYESIGYEPLNVAREKAVAKGAKIIKDEKEIFKENTKKYHAITLWHVLEHLHDFPEILNKFYTIIHKRGVLVIALPMANSADALYYDKFWAALDLPRHLYHFVPETIKAASTKSGFEFIERKGMPFDSFYISLLSEKNKQSKTAPVNAFLVGCMSNIKAKLQINPWSSEIFVFRKIL